MNEERRLSVVDGGKAKREGHFQVVSDGMIMDMIGLLQLGEPKGVSLNQLNHVLDRVREGQSRVDWYALRDSLRYLADDGRLKSKMVKKGNLTYARWQLADWEEWWRIHSRLIG